MTDDDTGSRVTRIISRLAEGEPGASPDDLLPLVYGELRRLAQAYLAGDHTLQATELVHEAYLRLVQPSPGGFEVILDQAIAPLMGGELGPDELLALDVALDRLAERDPRATRARRASSSCASSPASPSPRRPRRWGCRSASWRRTGPMPGRD